MTTSLSQQPPPLSSAREPSGAKALMRGIGLATPPTRWPQDEIAEEMAARWNLEGQSLDRWKRIVAGSEIDSRQGIAPPGELMHLSTAERMQRYQQHAPALAHAAACNALTEADLKPEAVTDLIVITCTGFASPGVDCALVQSLQLPASTRRMQIGFMGCFGGITGLRAGINICAADPTAAVLIVCVELCSLHLRREVSSQNMVASALFADGVGAVVLTSENRESHRSPRSPSPPAELSNGSSLLLPEAKEWMSWRITDAGFAMTLDRHVPVIIRDRLAAFVEQTSPQHAGTIIAHPGGAAIVDAIETALGLTGDVGLDAARSILRQYGNMSSPTVLFVLERILRQSSTNFAPGLLLAFGPGLTIESLRIAAASDSA